MLVKLRLHSTSPLPSNKPTSCQFPYLSILEVVSERKDHRKSPCRGHAWFEEQL